MNYQQYHQGPYGNYRRGQFETAPDPDQNRKLFVGGLSPDTDDKSLRTHFEKYGEIRDCIVLKEPATKRSRRFGFVTFKEPEGLDDAQKNRPHTIDGKKVETKRAMPRDDPQSQQEAMKIFVGGIKDGTTDDMIRDAFSGNITKVELIKDKNTGKLRGFCFVTFDDSDTVDKHVLTKYFDLNGRRVEVKKATEKDQGYGYGPNYGPNYGSGGGYGQYGPGPGRGGYAGGNYGHGHYPNQGWNQGPNYGDYGYGPQGGYGSGGYGGGNYGRHFSPC
ncbi:heterogeneous nuclear ribonucleoprotein A1-like [Babylonia areolata]|uniref:heterogeneous nuclear ribonucleoprotein A1-like n=1 Tax=Babylonia areolata TaxID=304850 RepID=UPI003FD543C7